MGYYNDVVRDLQWAVMEIQQNGILIDQALCQTFHKRATERKAELRSWLSDALGYDFNPNSSKQVLELFNNDFLLPLKDSSDELALRKTYLKAPEAKPFVEAILEHRAVGKLASTYLEPEPWKDGRVRSQFRVYGTKTWRLSSREPNLQNLPRPSENPTAGIEVRSIYCAPPKKILVEFDKRQLEARIPAYAARCKKQIERFESGVDLYCAIASACTGREVTKADKETRYNFKQFKLADGYGASPNRVSDTMLLNTGKWYEPYLVKKWQDGMKADTPEIYAWFNTCWDYANKHRELREGFGVPRLLYGRPDDFRQVAYSWPTQATASGILNRALVRIWRFLQSQKGTWWDHVKIICQIHDALLFEIPQESMDEFIPTIFKLMDAPETIFDYTCVLPSDAKYGERWGEMKEVNLGH